MTNNQFSVTQSCESGLVKLLNRRMADGLRHGHSLVVSNLDGQDFLQRLAGATVRDVAEILRDHTQTVVLRTDVGRLGFDLEGSFVTVNEALAGERTFVVVGGGPILAPWYFQRPSLASTCSTPGQEPPPSNARQSDFSIGAQHQKLTDTLARHAKMEQLERLAASRREAQKSAEFGAKALAVRLLDVLACDFEVRDDGFSFIKRGVYVTNACDMARQLLQYFLDRKMQTFSSRFVNFVQALSKYRHVGLENREGGENGLLEGKEHEFFAIFMARVEELVKQERIKAQEPARPFADRFTRARREVAAGECGFTCTMEVVKRPYHPQENRGTNKYDLHVHFHLDGRALGPLDRGKPSPLELVNRSISLADFLENQDVKLEFGFKGPDSLRIAPKGLEVGFTALLIQWLKRHGAKPLETSSSEKTWALMPNQKMTSRAFAAELIEALRKAGKGVPALSPFAEKVRCAHWVEVTLSNSPTKGHWICISAEPFGL